MDMQKAVNAVKQLREASRKRKFVQSIDMSISLKNVNLKKPENKIDLLFKLPRPIGKNLKICAFVGNETEVPAKKVCDLVIHQKNFGKYEKRAAKTLVREYEYFIAQGDLMPKVAASFGKYLGTLGKMPNPKQKTILPIGADIEALVNILKSSVKLSAKKQPVINCIIGKEDMKDEDIAENIIAVFNEVLHHLSEKERQIAGVYVKTTMGKPVKIW